MTEWRGSMGTHVCRFSTHMNGTGSLKVAWQIWRMQLARAEVTLQIDLTLTVKWNKWYGKTNCKNSMRWLENWKLVMALRSTKWYSVKNLRCNSAPIWCQRNSFTMFWRRRRCFSATSVERNAGYVTSSQRQRKPAEGGDVLSLQNQRSSVQLLWSENWYSRSSKTVKTQSRNITFPEKALPTVRHTMTYLRTTWKKKT